MDGHRVDSPSKMFPRLAAIPLLLATAWPGVCLARPATEAPGLHGRVLAANGPAGGTAVFAYEVASTTLQKVLTDRDGRFLFDELPAGLYKVVAHKTGFQPAVEVVLRRRADDHQAVELRLADERADALHGEAFWEARRAVPADVLREMYSFLPSGPSSFEGSPGDRVDLVTATPQSLRTELSATGGVEQLGAEHGDAERRGATIGVEGALGDLKLGVRGKFEELAARDAATSPGALAGELRTFDVDVSSAATSALRLSTSSAESAGFATAELSRHRIDWAGRTGDRGHSEISAGYVEEQNFHRQGRLDPVDFPLASKTWDVAGQYRHDLTGSTSLEAGVRYEQRSLLGSAFGEEPTDSLDVFGRADSRIRPRVLVEYGLFSTVRDEGLSLMPHGGLVVELGRDWKARGSFAKRVEENEEPPLTFGSARFDDSSYCREAGEACYEIRFARGEDLEKVSVGAVHREFAETLRLYFGEDFFDRLQSVFVVRGDVVPEVNFRLVRQISPRILATLRSNVASGGGGIFYATDSRAYENNVRYLVTSLDTRFQSTETGVFISFHHLEQALKPTADDDPSAGSAVEMQRLRLMLTQDLSALANLAHHFALQLNMELSRGSTPYTLSVDEEMHRKLTGGISVSF